VQRTPFELTDKDLKNWGLLEVFEEAVEAVFSKAALHPTFSDAARVLSYRPYLSLFLFGLFNPVVKTHFAFSKSR